MNSRLIKAVCASPILVLGSAVMLASVAIACPFCTSVRQTLRQEITTMDAAAIGVIVPSKGSEDGIDGLAVFRIDHVIRGDELLSPGDEVAVTYFGSKKSNRRFLLMGVDPAQLLWSTPLPVSEEAEKYLRTLPTLPEDPIKRLRFFIDYFEHEDELLARDVYDEFALASYDQIKRIKDDLSREHLMTWVQNDALSAERKRLYLTLLGICGKEEDADRLVDRMTSDEDEKKAGLDAMIGCYLTLKGDEGLPLVVEQFLANKESQYADTYAAIMALRFHGTEGGIIDRKKIVKAMHSMLERPQLADLVIPDLARWEDWSQIDKLVQIFKESTEDNNWVRVPVINYLRACPKPEAIDAIAELEKIDPKAVKRAKTFFPIPRVEPKTSDSSSIERKSSGNPFSVKRVFDELASEQRYASLASDDSKVANLGIVALASKEDVTKQSNRAMVLSVLLLFCSSLAIGLWLLLTSSGRKHSLAPIIATK